MALRPGDRLVVRIAATSAEVNDALVDRITALVRAKLAMPALPVMVIPADADVTVLEAQ